MSMTFKKLHLRRLLVLGALGCLLTPCQAGCAAGQTQNSLPMEDRFVQIDINNDGKVAIDEFRAAFPTMNEQAFVVIDKNGDNGIDRAEWFDFMENHSRGSMRPEGAPINNIPGDPLIPPPDSNDLPLVRPPMN